MRSNASCSRTNPRPRFQSTIVLHGRFRPADKISPPPGTPLTRRLPRLQRARRLDDGGGDGILFCPVVVPVGAGFGGGIGRCTAVDRGRSGRPRATARGDRATGVARAEQPDRPGAANGKHQRVVARADRFCRAVGHGDRHLHAGRPFFQSHLAVAGGSRRELVFVDLASRVSAFQSAADAARGGGLCARGYGGFAGLVGGAGGDRAGR